MRFIAFSPTSLLRGKAARLISGFALGLHFVTQSWAAAPSTIELLNNPTKKEVLGVLSRLSNENAERIQNHEASMRKAMEEFANLLPSQIKESERKLELMALGRQELVLRQHFLDRVTVKVDRGYTGKNLSRFLEAGLRELAMRELQQTNGTPLWRFLNYLSMGIAQIREPSEGPMTFLEGYMKYSSITHPKKPEEFLKNRDYSNGIAAVQAKDSTIDQAGEKLDLRIRSFKP